ncbi:MAG: hypothetical protein M0R40_09825 [Firmicutes bacterium]|nr:hypothetical protein [Bacillota bacterium]
MTTKSKKIRPVKLNHKTKSGYDYEHTILLILDFAGIKYTYGIDGYGRNDIYIILA